jgi:molybdenum cofactor guanylyltransferase
VTSLGDESSRENAAGFVLAGGASRRMGASKPLLPYLGNSLIEHVFSQVAIVADPVRIVGGRDQLRGLNFEIVDDLFPGEGPLGGVITALETSQSEWNVIVACDMPAVSPADLRKLLNEARKTDCNVAIPVTPDGRRHPLCAVYRRNALEGLTFAWEEGVRRLQTALHRTRVEFVAWENSASLVNVNTPAEWQSFAGAVR